MEDAELLRSYADRADENALGELIERHMGFVYAVALRRVNGNVHHAQDVTQQVLVDMGRKAKALSHHPSPKAWLFTAARFAAAKLMKAEQRRRAREEAHSMDESHGQDTPPAQWDRLRPALDEALEHLGNRDRKALVQRFFEGLTFAQIGKRDGVTEDGARLRVNRALGKMADIMKRRGLESTAAGLALELTAEASASAPPAIARAVAQGTLGVLRSHAAASATAGIHSVISSSKVALSLSAAVVIAAVVVGKQWSLERDRDHAFDGLKLQLEHDRAEVRSLLHRRAIGQAALQRLAPSSEEVLVDRVMALRNWFTENPSYTLPELRLMSDADWVGFAFEHPEIDAGGDLWPVAWEFRTKAVAAGEEAVQMALARFVNSDPHPPLTDPRQLLAYSTTLDADILGRYSAFADASTAGSHWSNTTGPMMASRPIMVAKPGKAGAGSESWEIVFPFGRSEKSRNIGDTNPIVAWP
ncbi:MAG TPA: sigma-70 family RNA polymerase sigma factor [Opitutaceae bacterium]|nr:sigma-70 family RNA polymerase sigma factor [Opitutaceae bacterium]